MDEPRILQEPSLASGLAANLTDPPNVRSSQSDSAVQRADSLMMRRHSAVASPPALTAALAASADLRVQSVPSAEEEIPLLTERVEADLIEPLLTAEQSAFGLHFPGQSPELALAALHLFERDIEQRLNVVLEQNLLRLRQETQLALHLAREQAVRSFQQLARAAKELDET
ncbi:MAG: hypothetical protein V4623_03590 [Pseudomonadota bacterium]